jgi:hypothetical protein
MADWRRRLAMIMPMKPPTFRPPNSIRLTHPPGAGQNYRAWGARTGSGLRTQNCEIKYKKPIDGGGGLNLQGLWGCHRSGGTRVYPQNSAIFFFLEGWGW